MAYDASRALVNMFEVVPSDTEPQVAYGFVAPAGGTVVVMPLYQETAVNPGGVPVTFTDLPAGFILRDVAIGKFMAATTAAGVIALGPR